MLKQIRKLEEDLEDWIENDPSILGEDLLVIGRQILIPEVRDKIDLLALDTNGNTVIIELKRGRIKDPVDIQAIRYASYVSRWDYNALENQARNYFLEKGEDEDFTLNDKFEKFLEDAVIDQVPDQNQEQRIIIVGRKLVDKLGSVALWLIQHRVDMKVIEVSLFKDEQSLFLQPKLVIPLPTAKKFEIGKGVGKEDRPWLIDGEDWHLKKRCGKAMRQKLIQLNDLVTENFESVEGPVWNQKFYVSFKEENHIWFSINTQKTTLILNFFVKAGEMKAEEISQRLGIVVFDKESSLSEKLQLESSVEVSPRRGDFDRVRIRIKEEFDIQSEKFLQFVNNCFESYKKVS